jgi:hypothetical protein
MDDNGTYQLLFCNAWVLTCFTPSAYLTYVNWHIEIDEFSICQ